MELLTKANILKFLEEPLSLEELAKKFGTKRKYELILKNKLNNFQAQGLVEMIPRGDKILYRKIVKVNIFEKDFPKVFEEMCNVD
jgi:hypothetical protein